MRRVYSGAAAVSKMGLDSDVFGRCTLNTLTVRQCVRLMLGVLRLLFIVVVMRTNSSYLASLALSNGSDDGQSSNHFIKFEQFFSVCIYMFIRCLQWRTYNCSERHKRVLYSLCVSSICSILWPFSISPHSISGVFSCVHSIRKQTE